MTPKWMKQIPPYEGDAPYLYFAFAEEDSKRVWKILRPLLSRGCRVWYCYGPAGSAEELLHRQERCEKAALTVVYLTDDYRVPFRRWRNDNANTNLTGRSSAWIRTKRTAAST